MRCLLVLPALLFYLCASAQSVYPVWAGAAPGSGRWNWQQQLDSTEMPGDLLSYNVVQPSVTYYPADPAVSVGSSVIICPGGSFCYLHINTEGAAVAQWLNKKGIAAFVLQYRLVHSETTMPVKEKNERAHDTINARKLIAPVVSMAIEDAKQSIKYVRANAAKFMIDTAKIGIMGFSAGGAPAAAVAEDTVVSARPAFAAFVYAFISPATPLNDMRQAPPVFICAASDDELRLVPMSINIYNKWLAAGRSAEMHIYARGGHGFGMNKKSLPTDSWIERFGDWLRQQGFMKK